MTRIYAALATPAHPCFSAIDGDRYPSTRKFMEAVACEAIAEELADASECAWEAGNVEDAAALDEDAESLFARSAALVSEVDWFVGL